MLLLTLLQATVALAVDDSTSIVDLSVQTGEPKHLASGFIYGIPDNFPNQIPDHWYTDIDFQGSRAGGAQLGEPARGWIWGLEEYYGRLNSTLTNYYTTRKFNAPFILLPHDIWGTDHANASTAWPGDNGDWTDYDNFVNQLMNDLVANNAVEGLNWDTWNEPDLPHIFWNRTQQQWIELFIRTQNLIRANSAFDSVLISGPSLAGSPSSENTWWTNWMEQIKGNNTIPDQWSYHLEGGPADPAEDPQNSNDALNSLLSQFDLPQRPVNINEYATLAEMRPSGYIWWISRLERYNFLGLLGNWQSLTELHDIFANLLTKYDDPAEYAATDYAPAAGYAVYKYYAQNMTGQRVQTTGSGNREFDSYATFDDTDGKVKILAGPRVYNGTFTVQITNLGSVGCQDSGTLEVDQYAFYGTDDVFAVGGGPSFQGTKSYNYSGGALAIAVDQTDKNTGWAFEFCVKG